MHGSRDSNDLFLSIGTGLTPASLRFKDSGPLTCVMSPSKIRAPRQNQDQVGLETEDTRYERCRYERLDAGNFWDIGSTKSEGKLWRSDTTLNSIYEATALYLSKPETIDLLNEVANMLVKRRRLRAKTSRWECFVFGVKYHCKEDRCPSPQTIWENRDELMAHRQRSHNQESPSPNNIDAIQEMLARCKTRQWSYSTI